MARTISSRKRPVISQCTYSLRSINLKNIPSLPNIPKTKIINKINTRSSNAAGIQLAQQIEKLKSKNRQKVKVHQTCLATIKQGIRFMQRQIKFYQKKVKQQINQNSKLKLKNVKQIKPPKKSHKIIEDQSWVDLKRYNPSRSKRIQNSKKVNLDKSNNLKIAINKKQQTKQIFMKNKNDKNEQQILKKKVKLAQASIDLPQEKSSMPKSEQIQSKDIQRSQNNFKKQYQQSKKLKNQDINHNQVRTSQGNKVETISEILHVNQTKNADNGTIKLQNHQESQVNTFLSNNRFKTVNQLQKIAKNKKNRFFILDIQKKQTQWQFKLMGNQAKIYTTIISQKLSCNCIDFRFTKKPCKHIYFILAKVAQAEMLINQYRQSINLKEVVYQKINILLLKRLERRLKHKININQTSHNTICIICYGEMQKNMQKIEHCQFCKGQVHSQCLMMWKKHIKTCPICLKEVQSEININQGQEHVLEVIL